jgi:TonB-linked SusC/RagA family outer membrane protein
MKLFIQQWRLTLFTLFLLTSMNICRAQHTITGQVFSKSDQTPIAGATVIIKGSKSGIATNVDGRFSIKAKEGDVLVITGVGITSQEVVVGSENYILISVVASAKDLNEVVVTALGIKKEKRSVGYATQEVKGEALEKAREPNIVNGLNGKVAGLTILTATTMFENSGVYLRGQVPVFVVDGIVTQSDTWNLSPDDIENITVLKSDAAALLYGSPGINGAIQITTKKGKSGANGFEVALNETFQFDAGFLNLPKTQTEYGMGWSGYYAFTDGQGGGGWYDNYGYVWGPKLNQKDPSTASGYMEVPQYNSPYDPNQLYTFAQNGYTGQSHYKPMPWVTKSQSNLANFLQTELLNTLNVSVSGKTEKSDYRISITQLNQKGQVPNTKLGTTTISLAGDLKITDRLKAEATLSFNQQYTPNYPTTGYGPTNTFYDILLWMGPDVNINDLHNYWQPGGGYTNSNGSFVPYGVTNLQQFTYNYTWYNNPWFLSNQYLRGYTNAVVVGQANLTYDISKDLKVFVRSGITENNSLSTLKTPYSFIDYTAIPYGQYSLQSNSNLIFSSDLMVTYMKQFAKDFHLTASVGAADRYVRQTQLYSSTVGGLSVPDVYNLGNSNNPATTTDSLHEEEVKSLYGYADLAYKNMVYLNVSVRNDWTSTLQPPYNSYFFPSASLGLIVSEMLRMPTVISFAKLRGAYGNVASDAQPYQTLPVYSAGTRWNGVPSLATPTSIYSNAIQPNRTITREAGLEMKFLKNRIGFDFTYYNYLEKNFIVNIPLSQASGYNSLLVNGNVFDRRGIELVLNATPIKSRDFAWDIMLNYTSSEEVVQSWYNGAQYGTIYPYYPNTIKVGQRTDTYVGYAWQRSPEGQVVYDANGNPQYIPQQVNLGHSNEDWSFGLSNKFTYKSFTFSFLFDGRIGGLTYDGVEAKMYEGGQHPATANKYRDDSYAGKATYVPNGVVVTSGSATYDVQGNITSDSRKFAPVTAPTDYINWVFNYYTQSIDQSELYKRTFVKLREAILSYNLPPDLLKGLMIKSASVSIVGRNLLIFTKVPFMDPDGYTGTQLAEPSYRNIGINLNLKF